MKEEALNKTMDKVKEILNDAGVRQYVLSISGYKDSAEIVEESERDPEAITTVTQIEADEETLFVMIVTMLEGLIKRTTKPRPSYNRKIKINQVVARINLALRDTLLN
ncbi:hypothetical protein [Acidaminococcus timonensis]|uniref:hypothetical protein n=1 Tax=Acidaminococcus timonensis TaxID=1871002 RepID=UPI0008D9D1E5|nr:hypothetical protein [Acidaminococcus timonensis]